MTDILYSRDQLFRDILNSLAGEATERRQLAEREGNSAERDRWSAVEGNLQYARNRWAA